MTSGQCSENSKMSQLHPNNCLWMVDQQGIIIYYNLESKQFETLPCCNQQEILFKSVASCKSSLWGVTCDCRLFLYVFSATNKVVEKLETWENQRWYPTSGFSSKLLPTDRPPFSNAEGTKAAPKESFKLPSNNWAWKDADWVIEDWLYAAEFSLKQFTPEKTMLSLVRKRRHTRTAHYAKLNEWVEIGSMFEDKYSDPILDCAVGGQEAIKDLNLSTQASRDDAREARNKNSLAVWVVTVSGKVYFRKNVCALRPEGSEFVEVPLNEILTTNNNDDDDVNQQDLKIEEVSKITVNSYGLVWCLTSCSRCIVRLGVTRENLMGTYWQLVEPPFNSELGQISIGQDSVWAVDAKTNELWFRKGIRSSHAASNLTCAIGVSWVRLTNEMSYVSVNPFDQCWALSRSSKKLYFRMGIEPGNLQGKMWKLIAKIQDTESGGSGANNARDESESGSLNDLTIKSDVSERSSISTDLNFVSNSSSVAYLANQTSNSWRCLNASTCLILNDQFFKANNYLFQKKHNVPKTESICEGDHLAGGSMDSSASIHSSMDQQWKNQIVSQLYERFESEMNPYKGKYSKAIENGSWLKSASVYYMNNEAKIHDLMSLDLNCNNLQTNLVSQMSSYLFSTNSVLGYSYSSADFIRCHLELDRDGSYSTTEAGTLTFKFANENRRGKTTYKTNVVNLAEIICITSSANITNFPYPNVLFIYLTKFLFIFTFDDEKELDDWFATLNVACNCLNNLNEAIFSPLHRPIALLISLFGQAYAGFLLSDRSLQTRRNKLKENLEQNQQAQRNLKYKLFKLKEGHQDEEGETQQTAERALNDLKTEEIELSRQFEELLIKSSHCTDQCDRMFFLYLGGGNFKQLEYTSTGVLWGLSEDGTPLVHTNSIGGSAYKNHLPNNNLNFLTDTLTFEIYENQRYFPFVGWQAKLLPTDRPLWSDESGLLELSREQTKLPSAEWKWCQKEWDSSCDSTTDEDGWQYAIDFSMEFHSQKRISDLVRRRKWCRLAKLETTGPWTQLTREDESAVCLRSISMYEANFNNEDDQKSEIILYAIAYDGECFVRIGVSKDNPQGDKWLHVECREKLKSVSVSGQLIRSKDSEDEHFIQVWCVAVDGNCLLRHNVSFENPAGDLWFYIESPASGPISKLMSCPANCFMLDKNSNLYFRDKIKVQFPEGLQWIKMNSQVKVLHASFPTSDCSKLLAVVEVLDRQNRAIVLVIASNLSSSYNLTENYDFKWRSLIRNAFKFVTCA